MLFFAGVFRVPWCSGKGGEGVPYLTLPFLLLPFPPTNHDAQTC